MIRLGRLKWRRAEGVATKPPPSARPISPFASLDAIRYAPHPGAVGHDRR